MRTELFTFFSAEAFSRIHYTEMCNHFKIIWDNLKAVHCLKGTKLKWQSPCTRVAFTASRPQATRSQCHQSGNGLWWTVIHAFHIITTLSHNFNMHTIVLWECYKILKIPTIRAMLHSIEWLLDLHNFCITVSCFLHCHILIKCTFAKCYISVDCNILSSCV